MTAIARRCACRGFVEADPDDADQVERAVRAHQRDLRHASWRAREQLAGNLVAPEKVDLLPPHLPILRRVA